MKKIYILFALLIGMGSLLAQRPKTEYETDSKWFIGLNAGGIWHTSDVKNKTQLGWGFMVGRSFNYNYGTPVSFDLRMRYLRGFWVGQDKDISLVSATDNGLNGTMDPAVNYFKQDTATIVRNFQNDQHRIGLELAIHANRLRERTGLDLYVFGGIGINWWQAYGDVLNNTDTAAFMYDYASLNNDFSNSAINGLQDGTYESALNGSTKSGYNVTWMPSVGIGIGYQVGPRFQVGIEHKTTFTRTDLWDGKDYDANGNPSGQNDIYHYSGIYLKFNIRKRRQKDTDNTTVVPTPPVTPVNPITPTCIPPTVNVVDPFRSEYTTQATSHQIRADISNIEGAHQIAFKINGQFNTNFVYDAATGRFQSNVMLNPGQNSVEILVTNTCGTAEDRRIILRDVPQSMAPPIVSYQNPPYSPYETELSVFPLSAQVLNVDNRSQIQMTLNGANIAAFSFNSTSKAVSAQLSLNEGNNVVVITGTNQAGTDSKQTVLIRKRQQLRQPPVVNFVNPVVNPTEVNQNQASILATVLHVDNKQNIVVRVNGIALNQSQFDFNSSSNMLAFTANLVEGANTVSVRGTNDVGMDEKSTTLIWKRAIVELPPIVAFLDPIENPKYVTTPSYFVRARVQNVSSAAQINVWVNNVPTTNFTFNPSSQEVQLQTGLVGGANSFTVRGTNSAGMDEKSTTIIYRVSNPINPPVVNIISPLGNPAESSSPTAAVQATVLNVPSQQQISVFVNNQPLSVFAYNAQTHVVSFNAQLNEGLNSVRVVGTNQAGSAEDIQNIRYTKVVLIQPPVVTFVQPNPSPEEVQNSGYEMRATVQNVSMKNQILVRLNGAMVNPNAYSFNNATKEVVYNANLVLGSNVFEVTGSNTAGSDSKSAIVNFKKPEVACDKPVVNFNQPSSNTLTVDQQQLTIGVTIQHVTSANQVVVTLNGSVVNNLAFSTSTRVLSGSINLSEGMNAIEIVATNRCGSTRASRSINYIPAQAPCVPPSISRINPVNQTIQVQEGTVSVMAAVVNIEEASGVEVQVNGSTVASNFDAASHLVSASVNLSEGTNIILITVENECGQSSTQWKVQYAGCKSPVINLSTSSGAGNITDNPLFNLTGNIENVDNSQNIQVTHNGSNVNFIYNPLNDAFSANINLVEGLNTIVVNATSRCGGDQKTFTTNYKPAVTINPPVVNITNPANSPHQTTVPNMTVVASVLNVTQASQISVTVNGNQTQFAYNNSLQQVQFNQNWYGGANVIVVTATNEAGTASDTKTVIYAKPVVIKPPVITFTNPVSNPHVVTENQYTVTGYVTNITSVNQVQSLLNNNPFAQFNPSISNGQLNFTVPLTFDNIHTSYTIQFVATNEAGSDQDARTIRRDRDETGGDCMPIVGAVFASNHLSVNVSSTKDLSNVVLKFFDETTQKYEGLSGNTGVFSGTGTHAGKANRRTLGSARWASRQHCHCSGFVCLDSVRRCVRAMGATQRDQRSVSRTVAHGQHHFGCL